MTTIPGQQRPSGATLIGAHRQEAAFVTALLAVLLIWLPLETPVALAAYQLGGLSAGTAVAVLFAKDAFVGLLVLVLLIRHRRALRWHWFDLFAAAYVAALVVYSVLPQILGDGRPLPVSAAAFRELLMPVELYVLGRVAFVVGVDARLLVAMFMAAAAVAATFSVVLYVAFPVEFRMLTHPVGTAYYFVVPLLLAVAATLAALNSGARRQGVFLLVLVALFVAAVITPVSRSSWVAVGVGAVICGFLLRRNLATVSAVAAISLFLFVTPPFSYAISSAFSAPDASVIGNGQEIAEENPSDLRAGHQNDVFNPTVASQEQLTELRLPVLTVAENIEADMYLAVLASLGPLGVVVFVAWLLGVGSSLLPNKLTARQEWVRIGLLATLPGLAISSVTASPFMSFATAASFWLMLGLYVPVGAATFSAHYQAAIRRVGEIRARGKTLLHPARRGS